MSSQFSVTKHTSLFGLNIGLAEHQSNLDAAMVFYQVRKDIERNKDLLRTLTPRAWGKRRTKDTFKENVELVVNGATGSQAVLPLLHAMSPDADSSVLDIFILVCFTMSKTTHANLEQKNLANVFSDFLKQVIDGCDIFSSMKETFITIIESVCRENDNDTSRKLLGLVGGEESRTKRPRLDLDEPLHGSAGPDEIVPPVFGAEVSSQPAEVGIGSSNVPPAQIPKEIVTQFTAARTGPLMKLLEGTSLLQAIMTSSQWRWERNRDTWQESGQATDTIAALIPDSTSQDISFVIKVGHDTGWKLIEYLKFESSSVMRAPPITF